VIRRWRRCSIFWPHITPWQNASSTAFAEYVTAAEAQGVENHPLHARTKATIENPAKKKNIKKALTLNLDDQEVYAKAIADALAQDLQPLAGSGLITRHQSRQQSTAAAAQRGEGLALDSSIPSS
jgi:hypothetical protein